MPETPPPPVQAADAQRIRAVVHNAADRALSARGYWVPLRVRSAIAETVLSALAEFGYEVVPTGPAPIPATSDIPDPANPRTFGVPQDLIDDAVDAWHAVPRNELGLIALDEEMAFILSRMAPLIDGQARAEERARIAADLRRAAEGRRQCTRRLPVDHGARELLADEAACYETAARIAEDPKALIDVLPVWMWTKEERDGDG